MIIMLAGRRKSGKTAFADEISGLGFNFKVCSFADALKADFSDAYRVPLTDLYDNVEKEKHRFNLIEYAESVRAKDRYYFANLLFKLLEMEEDNWVIDDLRTLEELQVGLKYGATPYKVYSDNNARRARGWVYTPMIDEGYLETELDLCQETFASFGGKWIFNNTNNREDLRRTALLFTMDLLTDKIME